MKEINEFPKIKSKKLKEEINNDNSNIQNNQSNLSEQKELKINRRYKGIKFCILYIQHLATFCIVFSFHNIIFIFNINFYN